jgi:hypothetical protein
MMTFPQFKIQTTSPKGSFSVLGYTYKVIDLVFEGWVNGIATSSFNTISIKPLSVMRVKTYIYKGDKKVGEIISSLGIMIIQIENLNKKKLEYHLQYSTPQRLKLDVFNEQNELQFSMNEDINNNSMCNKITRDYCIEITKHDSEIDIEELLIYCGYAARMYLSITDCNYYFAKSLKEKN